MNATRTSINCSQTVDKGVMGMQIFVTGGTGYVGTPIVKKLLSEGHHVRLLTRTKTHAHAFGNHVTPIIGDLFDDTSLKLGMSDADAVIHLVGIIREDFAHGITMTRIHTEGTARVVDAAIKAEVHRFIHMSALGARSDAVSAYHKSKWDAEKRVRQSGLHFTIFRPSVVFGPGGPGPHFVQQLGDAIRQLPFVPMIGQGVFQLQPVHTSTVADVFAESLELSDTIGETFDIGGPSVVSLKHIISQIVAALDIRKPTIGIPLWAMETVIRLFGRFGRFPLTMDQLIMLKEGNVCAHSSRLYDVFACQPIPFTVHRRDLKP